MRGAQLTAFCHELVRAVCRAARVFEFEGVVYSVDYATDKANEWLLEAESELS